MLARLAEREPIAPGALAASLDVPAGRLGPLVERLQGRGYLSGNGDLALTPPGRAALDQLLAARQAHLRGLLEGWDTENDEELCAALDRLARALTGEMPVAEPVARGG